MGLFRGLFGGSTYAGRRRAFTPKVVIQPWSSRGGGGGAHRRAMPGRHRKPVAKGSGGYYAQRRSTPSDTAFSLLRW